MPVILNVSLNSASLVSEISGQVTRRAIPVRFPSAALHGTRLQEGHESIQINP